MGCGGPEILDRYKQNGCFIVAGSTEGPPNDYANESTKEIIREARTGRWVGTALLAAAAERSGGRVHWLDNSLATVVMPSGQKVLLKNHRSNASAIADAIQADKQLTKELLDKAGVSTPRGCIVESANEAVEFQRDVDKPVVVKPRTGMKGRGITVGVSDDAEVREAFAVANAVGTGVIVEECIEGTEYRAIGTPLECVSVLGRIPPNVLGDGTSNIKELIREKNAHRSFNPHLFIRPIQVNRALEIFLDQHSMSLDSVPGRGERVVLGRVANFSVGGDSVEVSSTVGAEVKETLCRSLAALPGLPWGAIDVLIENGTGRPYVLEVNTGAAMSGHVFPVFGDSVDVAAISWGIQSGGVDSFVDERDMIPAVVPVSESIRDLNISEQDFSKSKIKLSSIISFFLNSRGWVGSAQGRDIKRYDKSGTDSLWLRGCLTERDIFRITDTAVRHGQVARVLGLSGIPRPAIREVSSLDAVGIAVESFGQAVLVRASRRGWDRRKLLSWQDFKEKPVNLKDGATYVVQDYPEGRRVRVIADQQQPLLAVSRDSSSESLEPALSLALDMAVATVRAIPGLKWAGVDLVVNSSTGIAVEGLTLDPQFFGKQSVLFGTFENVCQSLTGVK